MNRLIPATMATQHPDNARAPYWEKVGDGFVSTQEEVTECYSAFSDLGCQEFMWDWEGKHVDEAVIDKLLQTHFNYFKKQQLGRDRFLTFRIPNTWHERGYSLGRAFMAILTAEHFARNLKLHTPPLFEVILPLTDRAEHIIATQKTFTRLANFTSRLFHEASDFNYLRVWPLIESVDGLLNCRQLLERYLELHQRAYNRKPSYLRLHIARSDPALNSGLIPAVVAGKWALSEYHRFGQKHNLLIYPAIGVGLLPFRGGLSPERIDNFLKEYGGIRTVYVQSAFRYDFPLPTVKRAVARLNRDLPRTRVVSYGVRAQRDIAAICHHLIPLYRRTVEALANDINDLARAVPQRRERKLHVGLFGYSRSVGKKSLPRAIPFTAALYSLGVPPEFIGTGRGLRLLTKHGIDPEHYYINLRSDLTWAGRYLNKGNLFALAKRRRAWKAIWEDVTAVEQYLGTTLGPKNKSDLTHNEISTALFKAWQQQKNLTPYITESGKLRHSLG